MGLPDHGRIDSTDRKRRVKDRKCQWCPPNRGCNSYTGKGRPKPDKHKNHRRK
jgi:hypothetical protein